MSNERAYKFYNKDKITWTMDNSTTIMKWILQ